MADRRTRHWLLLMLLAALVFAACGSSGGPNGNAATPATQGAVSATETPSTASATGTASTGSNSGGSKSLDACEIVTAADAEAVLGGPVTKSDPGTEPQQMLASCVWDAGAGTGIMELVNRLMQFYVYDGAMFYTPDQYKEMPGFEKIDGLGDGAFAYGTGSFNLVILVGDRTIDLGASGFTPDDRARVRQAVLDLATKVLGRI